MKKLENGILIPQIGDRETDAQMMITKDLEMIGNWMIETDKTLKEIAERLKGGRK